jgi:hypothetical protein
VCELVDDQVPSPDEIGIDLSNGLRNSSRFTGRPEGSSSTMPLGSGTSKSTWPVAEFGGASLPEGSGARPDPLEPEFDQALVIARFLRTATPSPARPIAKTA